MKKLDLKTAIAAVEKTDGIFLESGLQLIKDALADAISDDTIVALNVEMAKRNRRKVSLDDIANVAYVHVMSIRQNDGFSPVARIIKWCSKNGHEYDAGHVGLMTDLLINIEFIIVVDGKTKRGKCRQYEIPQDVHKLLKLKSQ